MTETLESFRLSSTSQSENEKDSKSQGNRVHCSQVPPLCAPHYSDTALSCTEENGSYDTLGHYLRSNIFPGPAVVWSSLVKESYVRHPLSALLHNPQHWHGHKTDDMVRWTEQNILNKRLKKLLEEMEVKGVSKRV